NGGEGNFSCRLGPRRLLCTPTGVNKGFLTEDILVVTDEAGEPESSGKPRVQLLASFKRPVVPLPEAECRVLAEQRRAAQKKGR
ncbi:MAG: class II aldolase/adducin family protein, partial [Myxococcales bacterium]